MIELVAWNSIVFGSLVGYGWLTRRAIRIGHVNNPLGVDLVLGIFALVTVSGIAINVGIAGPRFWYLLVSGGLVPAVFRLRLACRVRTINHSWTRSITINALFSVATLSVATGNLLSRTWNGWDDEPAYFYLARRLWLLGNLHDPYNVRRLQSHGASTLLQALILGPLPDNALNAFDELFGAILLLTMVFSVKNLAARTWIGLITLAIVTFHLSHGSGNSTTILVFMAIYIVILAEVFTSWRANRDIRAGLLRLQLVVVVLLTLMRPYAGLIMGTFMLWQMIRLKSMWWKWINFRTTLVSSVCGIGWLLLEYRDSGTPFSPLVRGMASKIFPISGDSDKTLVGPYLLDSTKQMITSGAVPWLVASSLMGTLGLVAWRTLPRFTSAGLAHALLAMVSIAYVLGLSVSLRRAGTPLYWTRYWSPFVLSIGLVPLYSLAHEWHTPATRRGIALAAGQTLLVLGGFGAWPHLTASRVATDALHIVTGESDEELRADRFRDVRTEYATIGSMIPNGSTLLSAVQTPHLLLGHGFKLMTVDFANAMAPKGEFPSTGSFEDQLSWLHRQEADFLLVHSRNTQSVLYGYDSWAERLNLEKSDADYARYVLPWLDFTYELARHIRPAAIVGDLVLFDLR